MWPLYSKKITIFEKYRVLNKEWPWEKDYQEWRAILKRAVKQILFNQIVLAGGMSFISIYFTEQKFRFDKESFPSILEVLWQLFFMACVDDTVFYWSHRFLHTPNMYPKIHKIHHEFNHSISLCSIYAHPLEYSLGNVIPAMLGHVLLGNRIHYATFMLWLGLIICETNDSHSGFEFPWSPFRFLPFSCSSEYHNFHHSFNVGAYAGFFTLWDTFCGTNKHYFLEKYKKEKDKKL